MISGRRYSLYSLSGLICHRLSLQLWMKWSKKHKCAQLWSFEISRKRFSLQWKHISTTLNIFIWLWKQSNSVHCGMNVAAKEMANRKHLDWKHQKLAWFIIAHHCVCFEALQKVIKTTMNITGAIYRAYTHHSHSIYCCFCCHTTKLQSSFIRQAPQFIHTAS